MIFRFRTDRGDGCSCQPLDFFTVYGVAGGRQFHAYDDGGQKLELCLCQLRRMN